MRTYASLILSLVLTLTACWLGRAAALVTAYPDTDDVRLAVRSPEAFAWNLFQGVNWPADRSTRGKPDLARKPGDPGPTVWETWKEPLQIFLPDGAPPASWDTPDPRLPGLAGQPADLPWDHHVLHRGTKFGHKSPAQRVVHVLPKSSADLVKSAKEFELLDQTGRPIWFEIRMNRDAFAYIVANELYNVEGQIAAAQQGRIDFPTGAMEIKASWMLVDSGQVDERRYFMVNALVLEKDKPPIRARVALTGLHIISRVLPQWFWATFEHVDNPKMTNVGKLQLPTTAAVDASNVQMAKHFQGTVWQHYRLVGTQTDFTDITGRPTLLANTQIEPAIQTTSSCITCHALSAIATDGSRPPFMDRSGPTVKGPIGTPAASIFFDTQGKQKYYPLGFLWSLAEAQPRKRAR